MAKSTMNRAREPKTAPSKTPKPLPPTPFQALCIVARHIRGKPAAWLELRKLLDRVSHDFPPERFHQEFKELLERGK